MDCLDQVGLSRSGWPIGMSVRNCLDYVQWCWKRQSKSGGTSPMVWILDCMRKEKENGIQTGKHSFSLGSWLWLQPAVSSSGCLNLPTVMDWNLEFLSQLSPFSPKLSLSKCFYHRSKNKARTHALFGCRWKGRVQWGCYRTTTDSIIETLLRYWEWCWVLYHWMLWRRHAFGCIHGVGRDRNYDFHTLPIPWAYQYLRRHLSSWNQETHAERLYYLTFEFMPSPQVN